jgi:hypothetical protein
MKRWLAFSFVSVVSLASMTASAQSSITDLGVGANVSGMSSDGSQVLGSQSESYPAGPTVGYWDSSTGNFTGLQGSFHDSSGVTITASDGVHQYGTDFDGAGSAYMWTGTEASRVSINPNGSAGAQVFSTYCGYVGGVVYNANTGTQTIGIWSTSDLNFIQLSNTQGNVTAMGAGVQGGYIYTPDQVTASLW